MIINLVKVCNLDKVVIKLCTNRDIDYRYTLRQFCKFKNDNLKSLWTTAVRRADNPVHALEEAP